MQGPEKDEPIDETEGHSDYCYGIRFASNIEDLKTMTETCEVCGARLVSNVHTDFANMLAQESSRCVECGHEPTSWLNPMQ